MAIHKIKIFSGRGSEYLAEKIAASFGTTLGQSEVLRFSEMLGMNGIPFGIVFTKADKLSRTQCAKSVERYKATLGEQWEELPPMFVSSGERGTGREEILGFIGECLDV